MCSGGVLHIFMDLARKREEKDYTLSYHCKPVVNVFITNIKSIAERKVFYIRIFSFLVKGLRMEI